MDELIYKRMLIEGPVELKMEGDDAGTVIAQIATLEMPDKHGDILMPGAIGKQDAILSPWNHSSSDPWSQNEMPVGMGVIEEKGKQLLFTGKYFSDEPAQLAFSRVKAMGKLPQWSYSLLVKDAGEETRRGRSYRTLKKVDSFEVSPVDRGAGHKTRTISMKGEHIPGQISVDPETLKEVAKILADAHKALGVVITPV